MVGIAGLCLSPVLLSLLAHGVTWKGRALAMGVAALLPCAMMLLVWGAAFARWPRWRRRVWGAGAFLGVLLLAPMPFLAPRGIGGDARLRVEHVFTRPGAAFPRFSVGNMIPEADQAAVGADLAAAVDRHMDKARARRARGLFAPAYQAMARDPAFREMGSVMAFAYEDARGGQVERGHYVALVPRQPKAALLFLHGSVGNFSLYWYLLSELARRHGVAVLCPSFGIGNWQRPGGVETALSAAEDACRRFGLDPGRLFIAGLSNGGRGVTRVLAAEPRRFRGAILLSAVQEDEPVARGISAGAWAGLPVLLIHGEEDERIAVARVVASSDRMRAAGAQLTRLLIPGEDHFVLLSQRERVLPYIANWIDAIVAQLVRPAVR